MSRLTIHNPDNDAHFMRIKPVPAKVRVSRGGSVLAVSQKALRVMETGRDVYDPVIYVPKTDVKSALKAVAEKSTHCPLKGDCSYFTFGDEEIAWTYDRPRDWAAELKDHVAFYPDKVVVEEIGRDA